MRVFLRYLFVLTISMGGLCSLTAQELNATVKVNSSAVQGTNRELFTSLEEALHTFINGRRWSDEHGRINEKIDCTFTLVITEAPSANSFRGELYLQSRRPVRNATFTTPMVIIRDREVAFDYLEYQPLAFDPGYIRGNLTAVIAYYVYLVMGLELDSRYPLGGTSCFRQMELIAANVQPYGWSGWELNAGNRSRPAIAAAFNDGSLERYRRMWYDYHVAGVDALSGSADRGVLTAASAAAVISSLYADHPTSVLITLFGDSKLDELAEILSRGGREQRQQSYDALRRVYPSRSAALEKLR